METKGILILEDGTTFEGILFGAPVSADIIRKSKDRGYGEVVFNTSMTGYQEILTDPSYYGQMVCMTSAHIGNTGVNFEDVESARPHCAGFIIQEGCDAPSNWRSKGDLDTYLKSNNIPGLCDVDTRSLTRHLRSRGVVRGVILPAAEKALGAELLKTLPAFEGRDMIGEVTTAKPYRWDEVADQPSDAQKKFKVVTLDFGVKRNLLRSLANLGCEVEVLPANASAKDVMSRKPDGVFLSNGPGDPSAAPYAAQTVREILGQVPIFGVCMGHQILALAIGAKTYKLKFGHRGGNQPVLDVASGRVEISSHNHGYAVDARSLPANAQVTHLNLNDKTVEGLSVKEANAFSVQYHPEACPGPHDSMILFERFIDSMKQRKR